MHCQYAPAGVWNIRGHNRVAYICIYEVGNREAFALPDHHAYIHNWSDSMELGYGNMNLRELVSQALSVNVDVIILESHKNWVNGSPIESLKLSAGFMNQEVS